MTTHNRPPPMGGWNKGLIDMGPERFWARVDKSGDCWLWKGKKHWTGYGVVRRGPRGGQKDYRAHRFAFHLERGPIPSGMDICHRCDVRLCVRPDHLFLGTREDNMRDAAQKGRTVKKLSADDVREMRVLRSSGVSNSGIAKRFGVSRQVVWQITSRRTRKAS